MKMQGALLVRVILWVNCFSLHVLGTAKLPIVINTWPFTAATAKAWDTITAGNSSLDAVEIGCKTCEQLQCDGTVGYGGSPDESGETTLDAMIMDGNTIDVGAVGNLRRIKDAISVARAVMEYTKHTLLAGDQATDFALSMGFSGSDLHTNRSRNIWKSWKGNDCQPNFRQNVLPTPSKSCGPYAPKISLSKKSHKQSERFNRDINSKNHDTIGMIVIDSNKNVASGTSTNGADHKVPGRVGDSPIMGAGCYADSDVGGAAATGDGDVMMRFLPSFHAVELMRNGQTPSQAAKISIERIARKYPHFVGALVAVSVDGSYGASCHGLKSFPFSVRTADMKNVTVQHVPCIT